MAILHGKQGLLCDKKRVRTQCCRIQKISNEVGRIDNFRALAIFLNRVRYF